MFLCTVCINTEYGNTSISNNAFERYLQTCYVTQKINMCVNLSEK